MSSSNNNGSRGTPTGGNGGNGANNNDRPRLTEAEKKQNHIISEQKRRQAIRQGFDRLASMTPGMEGQGRSEATVLGAAVGEIKVQTDIRERIKRKVLRENPQMTEKYFDSFYADPTVVPQFPAAALANSPGASTGGDSSKGKSKQKAKSPDN